MDSAWCMRMSWTEPPLSMNKRYHHHARARITKEIRDETLLRARFAKLDKGCTKVRITLVWHPVGNRRRDAINLAPTLKAIEDGLVDYGLVPDDTPEFIEPVMPRIEPARPGQRKGEILVIVERLA